MDEDLRIAIVEGRVVRDADFNRDKNEISFDIGIQEAFWIEKRWETKTTFIPIIYSGANTDLYNGKINKDIKVRVTGNLSSREVYDDICGKYRQEIIVIANKLQIISSNI